MPCRLFTLFGVLAVLATAGSPVVGYANAVTRPGFILAASDGVSVSDAWARATPGGATTGAAYVMLMGGSQPDEVVGASTPVAGTAAVHQTVSDNGVMKMRAVPSLPVPAGAMVSMKPGGYHIMLTGLKKPLVAGETFPLTLTFAHSAAVTVDVKVRGLGQDKRPSMDHMKM